MLLDCLSDKNRLIRDHRRVNAAVDHAAPTIDHSFNDTTLPTGKRSAIRAKTRAALFHNDITLYRRLSPAQRADYLELHGFQSEHSLDHSQCIEQAHTVINQLGNAWVGRGLYTHQAHPVTIGDSPSFRAIFGQHFGIITYRYMEHTHTYNLFQDNTASFWELPSSRPHKHDIRFLAYTIAALLQLYRSIFELNDTSTLPPASISSGDTPPRIVLAIWLHSKHTPQQNTTTQHDISQ
jgi:hypothetical protein